MMVECGTTTVADLAMMGSEGWMWMDATCGAVFSTCVWIGAFYLRVVIVVDVDVDDDGVLIVKL